MRRLQDQYDETGMRRSVDAVIVCHVRSQFLQYFLSLAYQPPLEAILTSDGA